MRGGLVTGVNVDSLDIEAGMRELSECGWPDDGTNTETRMVIGYALVRWSRGEETAAQRGAIDGTFHGIDLTSWLRVLAAAAANGMPPGQSISSNSTTHERGANAAKLSAKY